MFGKVKTYYTNLQPPVKASLWFMVCGFLQKGISLLTTPIFTRIMTDSEYGRYAVYNAWFGIIQIIVSLNLAAGVYTRGLVLNDKDQDRFSSSMLGLSTTCILAWSVIYAAFYETVNRWLGLSTLLMTAILIDVWAHAAYQFWSNRERVHYRYKKLVMITLSCVILRPLLGVLSVKATNPTCQVEARVVTTLLVNVILFTGLYISIARAGKQFFNKKYWIYALKFNLPLVLHYLSQVILNQSDRLMIERIGTATEVAYYSIAYTIAMALQIVNTSISGTMNPWIYQSIKHGNFKQIGVVSYCVLGAIAILNFAIILAAPEILLLLAPPNYQVAVWVIPPVTASVYFMFLYNLFATFEYYYEKTHYVMFATVAGAVLNIVLNAICIPKFGFVAAGYTTLVCYILYSLAHYYFMRKVIRKFLNGIHIYDARIILLLGLGLIVLSFLAMLLYRYPWIRYGILFVIAVLAFAFRKKLAILVNTFKSKEPA